MPLIDNRPSTGGGTGGGGVTPGDVTSAVDASKQTWRVSEVSVGALDLAAGYITLPFQPVNTSVNVQFLQGPSFGTNDITVNPALSRITFSVDTLAKLLESFNLYGTLTIKAAYFSAA